MTSLRRGGQVDVGFIPLWMGLVTATGIDPPAVTATAPQSGISALLQHLVGAGTFTVPLLVSALGGGEPAYDGPFYAERSAINVVNRIKVPAFFVSGEYDLFQRGTPLLFENLNQRKIPTKLIVGPWDHLQASGGTGLGEGRARNARRAAAALVRPLRQGHQGCDARQRHRQPDLLPAGNWRLDEVARLGRFQHPRDEPAALGIVEHRRRARKTDDRQACRRHLGRAPCAGGRLCTRSASQWTAGILNMVLPDNPCFTDNALNDKTGVVFETSAATKP
ncbi:CocE/NonD family hydrolase [Aeromicrobium sp. UC242_57]|uniref:CocE/NonD family hydrolase n=1 Tax=Aeromicrobium sp. UC242_57 TaxID=3374624 RepID=UPI0037A09B43